MMAKFSPKDVSVIIPTYNEEKDIRSCILSLKRQSHKNFEITVVDDGSTDKTVEIIKEFKEVKIIMGQHKGPGFSRNLGARYAKGNILIFIDADMTFEKRYIEELIRPIVERNEIGTIHGQEYASNSKNNLARCWGKIRVNIREEVKEGVIFRAIKRDKFLELGGFDPKYGYADDQTFFLKYGLKSLFVPTAICYHKNPDTLKEVYRQSRWIGSSLSYQYPIFKRNRLNLIALSCLYLFFPAVYPALTLLRLIKRRDFGLFFYYWPFMAARYFGTLNGLFNFIMLRKNIR